MDTGGNSAQSSVVLTADGGTEEVQERLAVLMQRTTTYDAPTLRGMLAESEVEQQEVAYARTRVGEEYQEAKREITSQAEMARVEILSEATLNHDHLTRESRELNEANTALGAESRYAESEIQQARGRLLQEAHEARDFHYDRESSMKREMQEMQNRTKTMLTNIRNSGIAVRRYLGKIMRHLLRQLIRMMFWRALELPKSVENYQIHENMWICV